MMPTNFTDEIRPNVVINPDGDLAQAPSTDLNRFPEGSSARPAVVTVVPLLNDLAWETRPDNTGVYTDYRITLRIEEDNQTAELAPQEDPATDNYAVEYVNLSKPTLRLIAEWTAERAGQPPENPSKDLGDSNAVYIRGSWNPGGFEIASDGYTFLFQTAGRYEYGFKRPNLAKYGAGVPPWAAELMGLGSRPYIYGSPNISGIFPGTLTSSPAAVQNQVSPTLPGVPVREGQLGTQTLSTGGQTGPATLNDFYQQILRWQQTGTPTLLGGPPPGG